ncbi:MAG: S8 family serine peptidase [Phycisphaerales bacterium]|nr:S8 family serine peptidase [Phycisphaerales bacterium]
MQNRLRSWGYRRPLFLLAVCGLAAIPMIASAADDAAGPPLVPQLAEPRDGILNLAAGDIDLSGLANRLADDAYVFGPGVRYMIRLDGVMDPARRAALQAAGVSLFDYFPANCFQADLSRTTPARLRGLGFVLWAGEYRDEWRLDPAIGTRKFQTAERLAIQAQGRLRVIVNLLPGEALAPAIAALNAIPQTNITTTDLIGDNRTINVELPAAWLPMLSSMKFIQFVEEYPELTFRNSTTRWIIQSNISGVTPLYANGITGAGQIVGHMDGQMSVTHCSFVDSVNPIGPLHRKIRAYNSATGYDQHGTHTAGTAVGDAGTTGDTRGIAYGARICYNTIPSFTESSMKSRLDLHYSQGATVHTNSWGNDGTVSYDGLCRGIDNFSWLSDENLVLFAVTNTGSLKNPENAKNLLAVGASQDTPSQGGICSGGAGPTSDGRRKPEVFAPGCNTISSSGTSCGTAGLTGTSMACPAVTGAAALIRQYFADGYYPSGIATSTDVFTPSGPLTKAMLINSSVDMNPTGYPSNAEGWGRLLLDNATYFPGDARRLIVRDVRNGSAQALATGGTVDIPFMVNSGASQLRVTLAFHDSPGASGASNPVVNNLDLVVTRPDGTTYKGNVFTSGASATGGTADAKNNVEQVHINTPAAGAWNIRVSATAVSTATRQGYAVVVTGDVSEEVPCIVDLNGDGLVDFADYLQFLTYYDAADLRADFNGDGLVDFSDYLEFLSLYDAGC